MGVYAHGVYPGHRTAASRTLNAQFGSVGFRRTAELDQLGRRPPAPSPHGPPRRRGRPRRSPRPWRGRRAGRSRSSGASCRRRWVSIEHDRVPVDVHHRERRLVALGRLGHDSVADRHRVGRGISARSTSTTSSSSRSPVPLLGRDDDVLRVTRHEARERTLEARHDHPSRGCRRWARAPSPGTTRRSRRRPRRRPSA